MRVVSDTDLRVAMLSGAVVLFEAGVEREIADEVGTAALQMGARLVDGNAPVEEKPDDHWSDEVAALTTEADPDISETLNESVQDSVEGLVTIIETLVKEGDPKNFKADNSPKASVINKLAKRKVTIDEREAAWQIYLDR